jgi:hypothetical protein
MGEKDRAQKKEQAGAVEQAQHLAVLEEEPIRDDEQQDHAGQLSHDAVCQIGQSRPPW